MGFALAGPERDPLGRGSLTPIHRLDGRTYRVIEDPGEIDVFGSSVLWKGNLRSPPHE